MPKLHEVDAERHDEIGDEMDDDTTIDGAQDPDNRTYRPAQSSAEWVIEQFGPDYPDLLPVPDMELDENDDMSNEDMLAYLERWGSTIDANTIAVAMWRAEISVLKAKRKAEGKD